MESAKVLCERFNEVWYQDRNLANDISKQIVDGFTKGDDPEFYNIHYDRIFSNLNFSDIDYGKRIAILCFPHRESFLPSDVISGKKFSGSEEALVYMSNKLSTNFRVVIYANITRKATISLKPSNPRYLPLYHYHNDDGEGLYDIVICWRTYDFSKAKERLKEDGKIYLWVQDLPPNYIDSSILNGVFYLSEYQRKLFEANMTNPVDYVIAGNGLMPEYYEREDIVRKRRSCFYGSNYGKGLKVLLSIWDKVLSYYPDATLHICFGRTNWGTIPDRELEDMVKTIERHKSIIEYGRLSNQDVAKVMKSCSIFSYPCTSSTATFEIVAVQAQAAGCIPAVLWNYCLPEVIHPNAYKCEDVNDYFYILLQALREEERVDRSIYEEWGKNFTWDRVKDNWMKLMQ